MIVLKQITILFLNGMGLFGLVLASYAYISHFSGEQWSPIEKYVEILSVVFTLLGTVFVALTVYVPGHNRPPDKHSKYVTAPVILIVIAFVAGYSAFSGSLPPPNAINGFAVLAIAGALLRGLPFSEWDKSTW